MEGKRKKKHEKERGGKLHEKERGGKLHEKEEKEKGRGRKEKRGWDMFNLHNFVNLMYSTEPTDSVTDTV